MRYLGGKGKNGIAKKIAPVIASYGRTVWEPFCGGLSVTERLVREGCRVWASDACLPLIAMHTAVQRGWTPPLTNTREEWERAKTLRNDDPEKAFRGFGCSFGGLWFSSHAADTASRRYGEEASRGLCKAIRAMGDAVQFSWMDFVAGCAEPAAGVVIYCDPPYAGTQGYDAIGVFDHDLFWWRCREWARAGATVIVSEERAPADVREIAAFPCASFLSRGGNTKAARMERLFLVG